MEQVKNTKTGGALLIWRLWIGAVILVTAIMSLILWDTRIQRQADSQVSAPVESSILYRADDGVMIIIHYRMSPPDINKLDFEEAEALKELFISSGFVPITENQKSNVPEESRCEVSNKNISHNISHFFAQCRSREREKITPEKSINSYRDAGEFILNFLDPQ